MAERRLTGAAVQRLAAGLGERDWAILADVARVRVLTGQMVSRLHFAELQGAHRDRTRRRVLERMANLQLLTALDRRVGGIRAGSAGLAFALGPAGQRLHALEAYHAFEGRARRPGTPTERFMIHNLIISELYVGLLEAQRTGDLVLVDYRAEPASWWRTSEGEWIKPDAYVIVSAGEVEDHLAVEVDNATESVPTVRRKLKVYLDLAANGEHGPRGAPLPRVLITVPDDRRLAVVRELLRSLPEPAERLMATVRHERAVPFILDALRE